MTEDRVFPYSCSNCKIEVADVQALHSLGEVGKILCYKCLRIAREAKKGKYN